MKTSSNTKSNLEEVFALWEAKKGDKLYYTGKTSGDNPIRLVAFVNEIKKNPNQPDIQVYEQAAELGFESIGEAEQAGYGVDWENHRLIPDADKAYEDLDKTEKMNEEAKQIEMVHDILNNAKEMIAMVYRPDGNAYRNPIKDITDEKIGGIVGRELKRLQERW